MVNEGRAYRSIAIGRFVVPMQTIVGPSHVG